MKKIHLGPKGSFSEEACRKLYEILRLPGSFDEAETVGGIKTNDDIIPTFIKEKGPSVACLAMQTLAQGKLEGSFDAAVQLMDVKWRPRVIGALEMPISFAFLTRFETSAPMGVLGHNRAFGACEKFVRKLGLPQEALIEVGSNSEAARLVREDERYASFGALAPKGCAELYHLKVWSEGCEDSEARTMFYLFERHTKTRTVISDRWHALVFFDIKHEPAAHYRAMGSLATRGINQTYAKSIHRRRTSYRFCHEYEGGVDELRRFRAGLSEMRRATRQMRVFGPFPLVKL